MVTVDESGGDDNLSVDKGFEHAGGSGICLLECRALEHEDSEYWKRLLDEIINHERVLLLWRTSYEHYS